MKKIITLLLSIMMIAVFSVTAFATGDDELVGSVPGDNTSDNTSAGDENNSSESNSSSSNSSSSEEESSSEESSSSESVVPSKPTETVKTKLQIVELPKKTVYNIGETLDLTGLKVNVITSDGIIISQDGKNLDVSPTKFDSEGEKRIEVRYQGLTATFKITVNPAHQHKFGAWTIEKEATCAKEGKKVRECECEYKETQVIEKLAHDLDEGKIIKTATQKTSGVMRYTCNKCKEKIDETIPILEGGEETEVQSGEKFKLKLEWWMIFAPVGLIIICYIVAIVIIFKKKK